MKQIKSSATTRILVVVSRIRYKTNIVLLDKTTDKIISQKILCKTTPHIHHLK